MSLFVGRSSNTRQILITTISDMMWQGNYGSLTIDSICNHANVKKGSFYHFFASKSDLAIVALEARWKDRKKVLDTLFSSTIAPLSRIHSYILESEKVQRKNFEKYGRVLGCADLTIGAELCATNPEIAEKVQVILQGSLLYIETAIRDAQALEIVVVEDAATSARLVLSFYEGVLTLARVHNNLALLDDIWPGTLRLLGVSTRAILEPVMNK